MECSCCMENKINCVLIPCGLQCSGCIMTDGICLIVDKSSEKVQRLYFT